MITQNRPSSIKRKTSFSFKRQTNDSQNIEETKSSHARDYRIFTYCFYNNINEYYSKRHKDVLGELEDCYKLPLAKEQKMFIKQNLDSILNKNIFKLTKEILMRNVCIAKNINNYSENYNKMTKSSSTQATNLFDIQSMQNNHKDNRNPSYLKQSIKKRPSSSSKNQEKRFVDSPQHKNSPNRIISMGKYSYGSSQVNNEQTESYIYMRQNWRRVSKTKFHSKYLKCKDRIVLLEQTDPSGFESDAYLIKNKSEIMETLHQNEKSISQLNEKGQKVKIQSRQEHPTFVFDLRPIKTKESTNKFFNTQITNNSKQNSIQQMSKIKVQKRILSINNNFLTGITKSQGYKPKSKCWATPANSITKLNIKDRTHFRSTVHQASFQEANSNNQRQTRFLSTFLRYKP